MGATQLVSLSLVSMCIIVLLKQYKKEYAILATILVCSIILSFAFSKVKSIIFLLNGLVDKIGIEKEFFEILLKITGIAYLVDFGANVCRDAEETALASKLEFAGKTIIVTMSIPIIVTLIETITSVV